MSGKTSLVEVMKSEEHDNSTVTANSMPAFKSTTNACLDLFFLGAAYRKKTEADIISLFSSAYNENAELAIRILTYFRDVREGAGERRFFRVCLTWLINSTKQSLNLLAIPEIGRWDDLLCLLETPAKDVVLDIIKDELGSVKPSGLCAKWMPRKGRAARLIREHIGLYPKDYRRLIVSNTSVVETKMCKKQWPDINYEHVPSVANVKYNKAFLRNDETRRRQFLELAKSGKATIKSSVSYPHDIVGMMLERSTGSLREGESLSRIVKNNDTAIAMWSQLPNVIGDGSRRLLVCSDTSGSMAGQPLLVSLAMGIYASERLTGPFKNAFITFSTNPILQYTEGNLYERLCQIKAIHPSNTDLYKVFKVVLDTAVKHKVPENEMPTDVAIVSDMQFDKATGHPKDDAFKMIRKMYADSGYDMPNIIFWNVSASSSKNVPIERDSRGVALISGASQNALKAVLNGITTPVDVMLKAVSNDRYNMLLKQPEDLRK